MSITLFPYHPATGLRLVQTIDYIPAAVPREIFKRDGQIQIEDAAGSNVHWDNAECQQMTGDTYLADESGTECLASEAIWSLEEGDSIDIDTPKDYATVTSPNVLRTQLLDLASAAREVVLDSEQKLDSKASCLALKELLQKLGLWEDFQPDEA
ncbi:hypothetical protein [Pseudomonas mosselii]|uniref:hypothetical protein n=1 Tax=Pseudomonas mosselii TaxID=78327 RepID=UPI0021D90140|nr:hypothetical protein [Pseudomonas mosselii]MCU9529336.1 hypothetical protein [Pseudomonas mosselii]MCU9536627.1 hypothetical protein [Pseudomonas mosselii]MCU9542247.1 hypothetical protein [Pseudomonas mosselii]MCU9548352.1 hypothetical protein [Pseudomonas mosselii]